jgi:hypothetical protein
MKMMFTNAIVAAALLASSVVVVGAARPTIQICTEPDYAGCTDYEILPGTCCKSPFYHFEAQANEVPATLKAPLLNTITSFKTNGYDCTFWK